MMALAGLRRCASRAFSHVLRHTIGESVRSCLSHVCLIPAPIDLDRIGNQPGLMLHCVQEQRQICASYGFPEIVETHLQLPGAGMDMPASMEMCVR
jgi:hypothetical protein